MNPIKITTIGIALLYVGFMLSSCGGETPEHDHSDHQHENGKGDDHEQEDAEHVHIFSCPMHPEITGEEGGKCSKCGMDLEHTHKPANESSYRIDFKSNPSELSAGSAGTLSFNPKKQGDENALVPLDIHHEKKMHLMILSTDLDYFDHIHPEYNGQEYEIKVMANNESFPRGLNKTQFIQGGDYIMYVDYVPAGASGQLEKIRFSVSGTPRENKPLGSQRLVWENDGYKAEINSDKDFTVNTPIQMKIHITKNEKPVTDLDKYLGALVHMVVLSEDTEEYLHVHPMESSTKGPDVIVHANFPKSGKYKVFMQFNHHGQVRTCDFVLEVR